ncbi:hypothetical protein SNEBB_010413 [Seison nebaliae]|nr:hypothetical protein SNEBB_010413 [Seison nebaliae]
MSERRKLLADVDRTIKKIYEGIDQFDEIWKKIHSTMNASQKDKYETELKKEIKKLQRMREQIKSWIQMNDLRSKKNLNDVKRDIELKMEQFRAEEKQLKRKPYSKEALDKGLGEKSDRINNEKMQIDEWLHQTIKELKVQHEKLEAEYEVSKRRRGRGDKDKDKLPKIKNRMTIHHNHIDSLEKILRLIDNDAIDIEEVKSIRSEVDSYVSDAFKNLNYDDNQYLFTSLNLEEAPSFGMITTNSSTSSPCSSKSSLCDLSMKDENIINHNSNNNNNNNNNNHHHHSQQTHLNLMTEQHDNRKKGTKKQHEKHRTTKNDYSNIIPTTSTTTTITTGNTVTVTTTLLSITTIATTISLSSSSTTTAKILNSASLNMNNNNNGDVAGVESSTNSYWTSNKQRNNKKIISSTASSIILPSSSMKNDIEKMTSSTSTLLKKSSANNVTSSSSGMTSRTHDTASHPEEENEDKTFLSKDCDFKSGSSTFYSDMKRKLPSISDVSTPQNLSYVDMLHLNSQSSGNRCSSPSTLTMTNASSTFLTTPTTKYSQVPSNSISQDLPKFLNSPTNRSIHSPPTTSTTTTITMDDGDQIYNHSSPLSSDRHHRPLSHSFNHIPISSTGTTKPSMTNLDQQFSLDNHMESEYPQLYMSGGPPLTLSTINISQLSSYPLITFVMTDILIESARIHSIKEKDKEKTFMIEEFRNSMRSAAPSPTRMITPFLQIIVRLLDTYKNVGEASHLFKDAMKFLERFGTEFAKAALRKTMDYFEAKYHSVEPPSTNIVHDQQDKIHTPLIHEEKRIELLQPTGGLQYNEEHLLALDALEGATSFLPHPIEMDVDSSSQQKIPRMYVPTPEYYPTDCLPTTMTIEYYTKLPEDTLFFIYFFMEGTLAQRLAATALKKRMWDFHKVAYSWMKRSSAPIRISNESEVGRYIYFNAKEWKEEETSDRFEVKFDNMWSCSANTSVIDK